MTQELLPNIYKVYRDQSSDGWGYSTLVKRPQGNILFARMGKGASIADEYAAIEALGGIERIYITDYHFAGEHVEDVAQRFHASIYCAQVEAAKIRKQGSRTLTTFDYAVHDLEPGLTVIPSPGHTSGGVCYRLTLAGKRYLFTGDLLYFDGDQWIVGTKNYAKVKDTLARLQALEVDYLVGCGDDALGCPYLEFTPDTKAAFFDRIARSFD
ncbi:MAG: MBL fold metallo-hydrolase [Chloroflexota bacterium]